MDRRSVSMRSFEPQRGSVRPVFRGQPPVQSPVQGNSQGQAPAQPTYKTAPVTHKLPSASELAALAAGMPLKPKPSVQAKPVSSDVSPPQYKTVHKPVAVQPAPSSARPVVFNNQPQQPRLNQDFRPAQSSAKPVAPIKSQLEQSLEQTVQEPAQPKNSKLSIAFVVAGVVVFMLGIGVSFSTWRTNSHVQAQTQRLATAGEGDENAGDNPTEVDLPDNALSNHRVAPDEPRYLKINSLNIDSRIVGLGTKSNNQLKAPTTIHDAGWYNKSAKPGQPGATLIDGHVHGPTKPAIFYNLHKLKTDDIVEIEKGNGEKVRYKVVKSQKYEADKTDMQAAMTPVVADKPGLNIITCAGKLDKANNTYSERLIVFATLAE